MTVTHIKDLTPDPANARSHNPRNVGMVERSLNEVGAARSIVIDENGVILAGNATIEAAAAAGIERVQVVDTDGETIIAVRRSGLTPEQKKRLAIYDNRTAELAAWDVDTLGDFTAEGLDLGEWWQSYELNTLLNRTGDDPNELWQGMPEFNNEPRAARTLYIHFKTHDDVDKFCELIGQDISDGTKSLWYPRQEKHESESYRFRDES
jgi:hypothetical protein